MIGYWQWHIMSSTHLSVTLCTMAIQYILQQEVSEQMNRKFSFQPPTLTLSPQTPHPQIP